MMQYIPEFQNGLVQIFRWKLSHNLDDGKSALNLKTKILSGQIVKQFRYRLGPMFYMYHIAPDKDSRQLGIYPPVLGLIGYFKF